jgi:hypothetical protein
MTVDAPWESTPSIAVATSIPMPGSMYEYVSRVMATEACPSSSCTNFG